MESDQQIDGVKQPLTQEAIVTDGYAGLKKALFALFVLTLIVSAIGAFAVFGYISQDYLHYRARGNEADFALKVNERKVKAAYLEADSIIQSNMLTRAEARKALVSELKLRRGELEDGLKAFKARIAEQENAREAEYASRTNDLEKTYLTRKSYLDEQIKFLSAECERLRDAWADYSSKTGLVLNLEHIVKALESQRISFSKRRDELQKELEELGNKLDMASANLMEQVKLVHNAEERRAKEEKEVGEKIDQKSKLESEIKAAQEQCVLWKGKASRAMQLADKEEQRLLKLEEDASGREKLAEQTLQRAKKIEQEAEQGLTRAMTAESESDYFKRERAARNETLGKLQADVTRLQHELKECEREIEKAKGIRSKLQEEIEGLNARKEELSKASQSKEAK